MVLIMNEKELELKKDIINKLIGYLEEVRRITNIYNLRLEKDFIHGFILGAETMLEISIPSHWYNEIIIAVNGSLRDKE